MDELIFRMISLGGFVLILIIAWGTGNRSAVNGKTAIGSLILIWLLGGLIFWFPLSREILKSLNDLLIAIIEASQKGSIFLFGPLALAPGKSLPDGSSSIGFVLAMQVLPSVIFFSASLGALYYLKIMPAVVRFFARVFYRTMNLSGAESLAASANIFVGIESSLMVRPFLSKMTRSELLTLLTCLMATVASTVMGVYVIALKNVFPEIAGHLVSASIISIPCAVLVSKLAIPEKETPETLSSIPSDEVGNQEDINNPPANLMVALIEGGGQGVKLAVGIATLLIVVLGLEAVVDLALGKIPFGSNESLSLNRVLEWVTWPFVIILGLRPEEWNEATRILGSRFVETEVTAYFSLAAVQSAVPPAFSPRSFTILTYALCGFVHVASLGIFIGGLTALMPDRIKDLSVLGLQAFWTAFLATLLTGCVAGTLG